MVTSNDNKRKYTKPQIVMTHICEEWGILAATTLQNAGNGYTVGSSTSGGTTSGASEILSGFGGFSAKSDNSYYIPE